LERKPEQEEYILGCIVNKFGDMEKKVGGHVIQVLINVLKKHPKMV
jgi:hypothetical protein